MNVTSEALAWFDPALLASELFELDDEECHKAKRIVTKVTRQRFEQQTLTECSLNSASVNNDLGKFYGNVKRKYASGLPRVGCRIERPAVPIDCKVEPFAHVMSAGGTYAIVTEPFPQYLYLFDQGNSIAVSRLKLAGDGGTSGRSRDGRRFFIDEQDVVSALFLDPRGNFCVLRWKSGKAAYYYIPRCYQQRHCESRHKNGVMRQVTEEWCENNNSGDMTPQRFPLQFCTSVTQTLQPFYLEYIAWDPHNRSNVTTGDIILASSSGGIILTCRLEAHGVVTARKLYQFPSPYSSFPIDSVAYTVVSHPYDTSRRHVVLIAQRNRLFVFAAPWGRDSTLDAAFEVGRSQHNKKQTLSASFSSFLTSSPSCDAAGSGGLTNYISVSNGTVTATTNTTSSCSIGCHHRALSSTTASVDLNVRRFFSKNFTKRFFSHVVILEPHELLSASSSSPHAVSATGGAEREETDGKIGPAPRVSVDELPPVFYWQYGDILTHGILLLTDPLGGGAKESSCTAHTSPLSLSHGVSKLSTMQVISQKIQLPEGLWHNLLPINVLSVVNLHQSLHGLFALLKRQQQQRESIHRPLMFRFASAGMEKKITLEEAQLRRFGVADIKALILLRYGATEFKLSTPPVRSPIIDTVAPARGRGDRQKKTSNEGKEEEKGVEVEEEFVSFAMGYGHFALTTTNRLFVFCHLALLPFPLEVIHWKNSLVFTRQLTTHKMNEVVTSGNGDEHAIAFCSHDPGRSQVFHLFATTYIVDLNLHHRRNAQYVVQLMDATSPTRVAIVKNNTLDYNKTDSSQDTQKTESQRARFPVNCSPLQQRLIWRSPPSPQLRTSPLESSLGSLQSPLSTSFCSVDAMLPPSLGLASQVMSVRGNNDIVVTIERIVATYRGKVVIFPNIGLLGGQIETGFFMTTYYESDNLYGMALRLAAFSSFPRERRDFLPRVRHMYASFLFRQRRFLEAAAQHGLAMDGPPYLNTLLVEFSRVAIDDVEPLILLLLLHLRAYEQHRRDVVEYSIEVTCLVTWLVSLLLERCNQLGKRREGENKGPVLSPASISLAASSLLNEAGSVQAQQRSLQMTAYLRLKYNLLNPHQLLDHILSKFSQFVEWQAIRAAVFGIASSELNILICDRLGRDREVFASLFLQQGRPFEGLVRLGRYGRYTLTPTQKELYEGPYQLHLLKACWMRYASLLMRFCPCRFVRHGLIPFGSELGLSPVQLIPALLLYDPRRNERTFEADGTTEVVLQRHMFEEDLLEEERAQAGYHAAQVYLEHVIYTEGCVEECLLNLLMYFTARDGDDAVLTHFFEELYVNNVAHALEVSYAYRVCWHFKRPVGCAWVCFISGRYEESVRLAMNLRNEELAIQFIRSIKGDDARELRQALWKNLAIITARNRSGGSRRALQLVSKSEGDLNLSDVLPHLFSDVMMLEFREELLMSVSNFSKILVNLKSSIETSIKDVEALRHETETIRSRPLTLPSTQRCAGCGNAALTRSFVAFKGCRHVYHKNCFDAHRSKIEEQLCYVNASTTSLFPGGSMGGMSTPIVEDGLECVLCSTRYLRLLLTTPLSNSITGHSIRLP